MKHWKQIVHYVDWIWEVSIEMKWINEFVRMKWYDMFLWTDNCVKDDGAHLLYDSLRYNRTLTELNLDKDCEQMWYFMNDYNWK